MTVTKDDFNKIWASTSPVPTYTFSDTDYQDGWDFVGNLPPTRAMWDEIQRKNDEKMQLLYNGASFWVDSVADLRTANASIGEVYATKGYYTANDGGNGFYVIRADNSDTDDGGSIIILDNDNVAEMIADGIVNVKQFGAYGDGTHDDTNSFNACIAFCKANKKLLYAPAGNNYYLPNGIDMFDLHEIRIEGNIKVDTNSTEIVVGSNATTANADKVYIFTTNGTIKVAGAEAGDFEFGTAYKLYLYAQGTPTENGGKYHAIAYSTFKFTAVNILTMECNKNGGVTAWMNENSFFCGHIQQEINLLGDYPMNNNIFYSPRIEGVDVTIDQGNNNYFYNCRLEGTNNLTFAEGTFNNIFYATWANFFEIPYLGLSAATWNVTDNGYENGIVQVQQMYSERRTVLDLNPYSKSKRLAIFESDGKDLIVKSSYAPFFETDLIPIKSPSFFIFTADAVLFNVIVEVFDNTGTKITGANPNAVIRIPWNSTQNWYASSALVGSSRFAIVPADGVAYYKITIRTGGVVLGSKLKNIKLEVVQRKDELNLVRNIYEGVLRGDYSTSAPTTGTWKVGDIVYNTTPTAGGYVGWVCTTAGTPGTWKGFGSIEA